MSRLLARAVLTCFEGGGSDLRHASVIRQLFAFLFLRHFARRDRQPRDVLVGVRGCLVSHRSVGKV